jgi:hypothetical protein
MKQGSNGNYNDSNPDDPDASGQHREHVRSSPSSQLPSPTSANPNGQASQNSVLQTPLNNEFLLAYNSLIPNSEFARAQGASADDTGAVATTTTATGTGRGG